MSRRGRSPRAGARPPATPVVEPNVPGPRGQVGCFLRAKVTEPLTWDLENEIASTRREWVEERGGWWFAASYLDTVIRIVLRSFPSVLVLDPEKGDRIYSRDQGEVRQKMLP